MISYIKGLVTWKTPTYVVLEAGGIGYHVNISLQTYAKIEQSETIILLTYQHITENSQTLYGFAEEAERNLFKLLISVSGIGANTAQIVLSSLNTDEIKSAIVSENDRVFSSVKGIGPKTAKRIILDLKDKVVKDLGEEIILLPQQDNTIRDEALSALIALGFNKIQVQKLLNQLLKGADRFSTVEELIKAALKQLS
jgi:Holliday junction DNA helicase RuvA